MNPLPHLSLQQKLVSTTFLLGFLLAAGLWGFLSWTQTQTVEITGVTTGRAVSSQIVSLRAFYTKEITPRALKAGMRLDHNFATVEGALPLPATLVKTLGDQIARDYPGTQIYLKSNYPFQNRAGENTLDEFQQRALAALEKQPKVPIHQLESYQGRLSIRYAVADIMAAGCVACHNNHPLSPKKDWKVGDVRGIVEVIVPVTEVDQTIARNSMITVALTFCAFAVMGIVIWIVLQRILVTPLRHLTSGIHTLAKGDLSWQLSSQDQNEIGQLTQELEKMRLQFQRILKSVQDAVIAVSDSSGVISAGNHELHARTEQTASTLEETAAAMEQLGSTINQNAGSAQNGNILARNASSIASQGGVMVGQLIHTMKEINESSNKIVDIIGVIDGIAFQTNILALNAAVEAARAGEQGRGFAVVAGEVRSLASRSSEAAKSIKHLITDSVERVHKGTALVDQAGNTMTDVVAAIDKVSEIMHEFSNASKEQALGITQVGQAVSQMDQTTQQNAMLVQEIKQTSQQLKQQADELEQQVRIFKIGRG